jgi:hypothetical protein
VGLLETMRRVMASDSQSANAEQPDAIASNINATEPDEVEMANENASGAANSAGITEADHKAAVAKAAADGKAEGAKAANERMGAILGAEGVKGDGKRMAAGLDLALKSPDMAAEAVVSFVTDNVAATAAASAPGKGGAYEQQRLAAAQLVQPNGGQPAGEQADAHMAKAGWSKAFTRLHS